MSIPLRPLRPEPRLRVGISGHRGPPKLPVQSQAPVRSSIERALATFVVDDERAQQGAPQVDDRLAKGAADRSPEPGASTPAVSAANFVVISSLAEGADRMLAEAGLAAGFALEAVLPFSRAEYSRDFETPELQSAFEQLLARATAVFELDGAAEERAQCYRRAFLGRSGDWVYGRLAYYACLQGQRP